MNHPLAAYQPSKSPSQFSPYARLSSLPDVLRQIHDAIRDLSALLGQAALQLAAQLLHTRDPILTGILHGGQVEHPQLFQTALVVDQRLVATFAFTSNPVLYYISIYNLHFTFTIIYNWKGYVSNNPYSDHLSMERLTSANRQLSTYHRSSVGI